MGDISSGNAKSVDVYSVDCEVEGVEYEVLTAELPATSERQAIFQTVAHFFCDSSAPAGGLCSSVAPPKSKSPNYSFSGGNGR
jgi:hypothetical protein